MTKDRHVVQIFQNGSWKNIKVTPFGVEAQDAAIAAESGGTSAINIRILSVPGAERISY